ELSFSALQVFHTGDHRVRILGSSVNGSDRSTSIPCRLTAKERMFEGEVVWARPNSLVVAVRKGEDPSTGMPFTDVSLDLGGNWVTLGSCRYEAGDATPRRRREDPPPDMPVG